MNDIGKSDFDSPWKDILEIYFTEFMSFFFPQVHYDIDWQGRYEFLDTEFQQITQDSDKSSRN
ncbi:TPA: hypothetical protein ENX78_18400 [Candidatus Poribacteria bacterium]|nr:hypothetical protein [Candidatus Poribacteria bacterium]